MKPKLDSRILIAFIALFCGMERSLAAVTLTLEDSSLPAFSTTISPGQSFDVTAFLQIETESVVALTYTFTISASGSGFFSISARDTSVADYINGTLTTANAVILSGSNALLDPTNGTTVGTEDLGASFDPLSGGKFTLANFTISSSLSVAPGNYTLSISNGLVGFEDFTGASPLTSPYTITVIPEPSAIALVGCGIAFLLWNRRRTF